MGPGVQGNKYQLRELTVRWFSVYDAAQRRYLPYKEAERLVTELGLEWVPVVERSVLLGDEHTVDALLQLAEGKSRLRQGQEREGLVIRAVDGGEHSGYGHISFKAISNRFLLKHDG